MVLEQRVPFPVVQPTSDTDFEVKAICILTLRFHGISRYSKHRLAKGAEVLRLTGSNLFPSACQRLSRDIYFGPVVTTIKMIQLSSPFLLIAKNSHRFPALSLLSASLELSVTSLKLQQETPMFDCDSVETVRTKKAPDFTALVLFLSVFTTSRAVLQFVGKGKLQLEITADEGTKRNFPRLHHTAKSGAEPIICALYFTSWH